MARRSTLERRPGDLEPRRVRWSIGTVLLSVLLASALWLFVVEGEAVSSAERASLTAWRLGLALMLLRSLLLVAEVTPDDLRVRTMFRTRRLAWEEIVAIETDAPWWLRTGWNFGRGRRNRVVPQRGRAFRPLILVEGDFDERFERLLSAARRNLQHASLERPTGTP